MDPIVLAFVGYLVGALFRTLYDFLWKAMDHPEIVFDRKYLASMLISIILSLISSVVTFTTIQVPVDGATYILLATVAIGFTMNHLVNKPIDYLSTKKG